MKNVIIIGATSGIGWALAQKYAQQGWKVGATGRRLEALEDLQKTGSGQIFIRKHDVTASDNIAILESLIAEMGSVDLIIYNSGVGIYNKGLKWEPERNTIAVNVTGFAEVATWAYNYFKAKGGGQIAGISSVAAVRGSRHAPAYNASKAFMASYLEGMRQKSVAEKIPVSITEIRPGFVDTPMTKQNPVMFWVSTPEKAAAQIVAAIAARKRVAYVTRRWVLMGWFMALLPRSIYEKR